MGGRSKQRYGAFERAGNRRCRYEQTRRLLRSRNDEGFGRRT